MNHPGLCKTDTKQAVNSEKALQRKQKNAEPILFYTFFRHFTLTVIAMPPFSIVGLVPRFLAVPFSP